MSLIKTEKVESIAIIGSEDYKDEVYDIAIDMIDQGYLVNVFLSDRDDQWYCDDDDTFNEDEMLARRVDEQIHMSMFDIIDAVSRVHIANFRTIEDNNLDSAVCYSKFTGKQLTYHSDYGDDLVETLTSEHLETAQILSQAQLELYKERDNSKFSDDDYVCFYHHNYKIYDAWHDEFFNNNYSGNQAEVAPKVNPFAYYGTIKAARFIEGIIRHCAPTFEDAVRRTMRYKQGKLDWRSLII